LGPFWSPWGPHGNKRASKSHTFSKGAQFWDANKKPGVKKRFGDGLPLKGEENHYQGGK